MALPEEDKYVKKPTPPPPPPPTSYSDKARSYVPPVVNKPAVPPPPPPPVTLPVTGGSAPTPTSFPGTYTNPNINRTPASPVLAYAQSAFNQRAPRNNTARGYGGSFWQGGIAGGVYDYVRNQMGMKEPSGTRTYGAGAPPGIDKDWWEAFKREHGGVDPETFYKGDLDAALRDRAWGDKFYNLYGRPPSLYDWKASYLDRKYGGGGGGGGGAGGGGAAGAAAPGMSPLWNAIMSPYYATRPAQSSEADYAAFLQRMAQRVGRDLTPDEATRFLTAYQEALVNRGATGAVEDLNAWLDRYMQQYAALPPIAYLTMGEI